MPACVNIGARVAKPEDIFEGDVNTRYLRCKIHTSERAAFALAREARMCVAAETVCARSFFEILKPSKEPLLIIERLEAIVRLGSSAASKVLKRLYWKFYYCCSCGKFNGIT